MMQNKAFQYIELKLPYSGPFKQFMYIELKLDNYNNYSDWFWIDLNILVSHTNISRKACNKRW